MRDLPKPLGYQGFRKRKGKQMTTQLTAAIRNNMIGSALWGIFAKDFQKLVKEEARLAMEIYEQSFADEEQKHLFARCPEKWFRPSGWISGILHLDVNESRRVFEPSFRPDISFISKNDREELLAFGYTFDDVLADAPLQKRVTFHQPEMDYETSVRAVNLRRDIQTISERYARTRIEMLKKASSTRSIAKLDDILRDEIAS